MEQYRELLFAIKEKGAHKPAARANMPGTISLFGYQFRHNLCQGFPLLTTKKINPMAVVVELLWFLRGDTNIKYLIDNGVNIWNEDAYNFYLNQCKELLMDNPLSFTEFIENIKAGNLNGLPRLRATGYKYGDCGFQYGKVWRSWNKHVLAEDENTGEVFNHVIKIDQIRNLIHSLKTTPESRRHIVTAIDPAHDAELALYWCHSMFQFNCRPIQYFEGDGMYGKQGKFYYWTEKPVQGSSEYDFNEVKATSMAEILASNDYPTYFLDCQLYQRSADVFLGVPYNIASYALLTNIIAKLCNMVPGEFIHTFGDVHIYDNHIKAVEEQLSREARMLPTLHINDEFWNPESVVFSDIKQLSSSQLTDWIKSWEPSDFQFENYTPHPAIKAKLSTGLIK